MASPNAVFTEMVTTTLRNHPSTMNDLVSNHNALYRRLAKGGKVRKEDGGYEIVANLEYAENATYQNYSGYDTLNINPSDVFTAAKYDWVQAAVNVTASGLELRNNSGKAQMVNLVKSRVKNAMRTFANNISTELYGDGTTANTIGGLQALIADAGTGTVGGINSSTYTWWKNVVQSAASPLQGGGAITPSKSTIQSLMLPLYMELTRGTDTPKMAVSSNDYFIFYEESLTDLKRYTTDDTADGGFLSLKYKGMDVYHDGGTHGGGIPSAHMYFVNPDYLEFVCHKDANMTPAPEMSSINQDASVIRIISQHNLVCSNRSLQGVLKA